MEKKVLIKENLTKETSYIIDYRFSELESLIIDKIRLGSLKLSELGKVIQGLTPYDSYSGQDKETIKNRIYHVDQKEDNTCGKWLDGKNLNRYTIAWNGQWLSYGPWLAAPREKQFFEGKRILFREVPGASKRIQAAITEEEFYYGHSISPFKPNDDWEDSLEYLLGVVNSKLISWYGKLVLPNFGKEVYPKLNPNDIKELPIAKQSRVSDLIKIKVKEIMSEEDEQRRLNLEWGIDQLVYELYGLTEEEIKIVEGEAISGSKLTSE